MINRHYQPLSVDYNPIPFKYPLETLSKLIELKDKDWKLANDTIVTGLKPLDIDIRNNPEDKQIQLNLFQEYQDGVQSILDKHNNDRAMAADDLRLYATNFAQKPELFALQNAKEESKKTEKAREAGEYVFLGGDATLEPFQIGENGIPFATRNESVKIPTLEELKSDLTSSLTGTTLTATLEEGLQNVTDQTIKDEISKMKTVVGGFNPSSGANQIYDYYTSLKTSSSHSSNAIQLDYLKKAFNKTFKTTERGYNFWRVEKDKFKRNYPNKTEAEAIQHADKVVDDYVDNYISSMSKEATSTSQVVAVKQLSSNPYSPPRETGSGGTGGKKSSGSGDDKDKPKNLPTEGTTQISVEALQPLFQDILNAGNKSSYETIQNGNFKPLASEKIGNANSVIDLQASFIATPTTFSAGSGSIADNRGYFYNVNDNISPMRTIKDYTYDAKTNPFFIKMDAQEVSMQFVYGQDKFIDIYNKKATEITEKGDVNMIVPYLGTKVNNIPTLIMVSKAGEYQFVENPVLKEIIDESYKGTALESNYKLQVTEALKKLNSDPILNINTEVAKQTAEKLDKEEFMKLKRLDYLTNQGLSEVGLRGVEDVKNLFTTLTPEEKTNFSKKRLDYLKDKVGLYKADQTQFTSRLPLELKEETFINALIAQPFLINNREALRTLVKKYSDNKDITEENLKTLQKYLQQGFIGQKILQEENPEIRQQNIINFYKDLGKDESKDKKDKKENVFNLVENVRKVSTINARTFTIDATETTDEDNLNGLYAHITTKLIEIDKTDGIKLLNYSDNPNGKEDMTLKKGQIDNDYNQYKAKVNKDKKETALTKEEWLKKSINRNDSKTITYVEQVGDGMTYQFNYSPFGLNTDAINIELSTKATDGVHFAISELSNMANLAPEILFSNTMSTTYRNGVFKINEGTNAERTVLHIPVDVEGNSSFNFVVLKPDGTEDVKFNNIVELKNYSFNTLGVKDLSILDGIKKQYDDKINQSKIVTNDVIKNRYLFEANELLKQVGFNNIEELNKVRSLKGNEVFKKTPQSLYTEGTKVQINGKKVNTVTESNNQNISSLLYGGLSDNKERFLEGNYRPYKNDLKDIYGLQEGINEILITPDLKESLITFKSKLTDINKASYNINLGSSLRSIEKNFKLTQEGLDANKNLPDHRHYHGDAIDFDTKFLEKITTNKELEGLAKAAKEAKGALYIHKNAGGAGYHCHYEINGKFNKSLVIEEDAFNTLFGNNKEIDKAKAESYIEKKK